MSTISEDAKLKLTSMRLSANPEATTVEDTDGIEGKLNLTKDGRKYYIATFQDPTNPFGVERYRVISQQTDSAGNAVWRSGNPAQIKQFVGKLIPGDIVSNEVEEYTVGDNTVNFYSCVVLKGENIETIFKQQGHEIGGTSDEDYDAILDAIDEDESSEQEETADTTETAEATAPAGAKS